MSKPLGRLFPIPGFSLISNKSKGETRKVYPSSRYPIKSIQIRSKTTVKIQDQINEIQTKSTKSKQNQHEIKQIQAKSPNLKQICQNTSKSNKSKQNQLNPNKIN